MTQADEKLDLFRWFGYTESEARFLYLVATHSGYFFLKHYADFLGQSSNKRTARLIRKALKKNHIMRRSYEHGSYKLYHLHSRRVYAELGNENTSLRKIGSVNLARTRLREEFHKRSYPNNITAAARSSLLRQFISPTDSPFLWPIPAMRN